MASSATLLATLRLEQSLKQHDLSDWWTPILQICHLADMCHVSFFEAGHALKVIHVVWYQVFIIGFKKVQELNTESPSKQPSMKSWVVSHILNCHIGIIIACQVFSFVPGLYRLTICSSSSDLSEPTWWFQCVSGWIIWNHWCDYLKKSMSWCHESQSVGIGVKEITVYSMCIMLLSQSEVTWSTIKLTAHSPPGIAMQALKLSKSDGEYFHLLSFSCHCLKQFHLYDNLLVLMINYVVISFWPSPKCGPYY